MKYIVKKEMRLLFLKNGEIVNTKLREGDLYECEKTVKGFYLMTRKFTSFTISEEELNEYFDVFVSDTIKTETLWLQIKVDKRNGEVVAYDSSLPNEFIKTDEQQKEFYDLCMDFKNKLQQLKDKGTSKESKKKYLLCTRSENRLFTVGKKYEILKTASNGSFSVKEDIFDCEMGVPLKGDVWEFELVSEEERKKPKLLCTHAVYFDFKEGKTYDIESKTEEGVFYLKDEDGYDYPVVLDGLLYKFELI